MKLVKRLTAICMAVMICAGLTACGSKDKTMWEAVKSASKVEYNHASVTVTFDSKENLIEEMGLEEVLGTDEVKHVELIIEGGQQDEKAASGTMKGSINNGETVALLEFRYVNDTYYYNVAPIAELLGKSKNAYMKVVGALLPTEEWIQCSLEDINNMMGTMGMEQQEKVDNQLKDQKKLALSMSEIFFPLLEKACGNDYVTKDGDKYTLTIDKDAANAIAKKVVTMEQDDKAFTKAIESMEEAFAQYGNDSLVKLISDAKSDLLEGLSMIGAEGFEPEEIEEDVNASISIENKKKQCDIGFSFELDNNKLSYDVEMNQGAKIEVAVPEKTISIQDFMQSLYQFN